MSMNQQFDAGLNIIESKQSVITQAFRTRLVLKLENYIILIYYGTFSNSTLRFGLIFVLKCTNLNFQRTHIGTVVCLV